MKNLSKILIAGLLVSVPSMSHSASISPDANTTFLTPLTLTKNNDANFGYLKANQAGAYVLATDNSVTASGGGVTLGGTPAAASVTIKGSGSQAIDISVTLGGAVNGLTPTLPRCSYDGGGEAACSLSNQTAPGSGAGKILLLGLRIDADGATPDQDDGATIPVPIPVTVTYH